MKNTDRCPKCESLNVISDVRLALGLAKQGKMMAHTGQVANAIVYGDPEAMIMKKPISMPYRACICGECGFMETYLENPKEMFHHYMEHEMPYQGTIQK